MPIKYVEYELDGDNLNFQEISYRAPLTEPN